MIKTETQNRFSEVLNELHLEYSILRGSFHLVKQDLYIQEFPSNNSTSGLRFPLENTLFLQGSGKLFFHNGDDCSIIQCCKCKNFFFSNLRINSKPECPFCNDTSQRILSKDGRIPGWYGKTIDYIIDEDEALIHLNRCSPKNYSELEKIIQQLKGVPTYITVTDKIIETVKALSNKYPNMEEVIDFFVKNMITSKFRQNRDLSFMPLVLIGSAGCGKSSFVKDICQILMGKPALKVDLGNSVSSITLSGTDPAYSQSKNGIIIESMFAGNTNHPLKNPVLHFDEIDKMESEGKDCVEKVFYSLLEPNTACRFFDNFLGVNVDASGINYIFTGNTLENIPTPIVNRLKVFQIKDYTHEQLKDLVMDSFYTSWISVNHMQEDYIPAFLSDEIKERILEIANDDPRSIHDAIRTVFTETLIYDESEHHDIALFSPSQLYEGWKKFRGERKISKTPWKLPKGFSGTKERKTKNEGLYSPDLFEF
ncbi:MAG: AAA family ATPase [Treponema sp.]|nr:AAA family ATPase [Treponema sp.]